MPTAFPPTFWSNCIQAWLRRYLPSELRISQNSPLSEEMNWAFNHYWCTQHWPLKESQWVNISFHCKSSEFSNLTPLPQTPPRWEIVEDQLRVRMTLTSIIPSHLLVAKVQLFQRVRFGREATHGCMAPGLSSAAAVGWTERRHGFMDGFGTG